MWFVGKVRYDSSSAPLSLSFGPPDYPAQHISVLLESGERGESCLYVGVCNHVHVEKQRIQISSSSFPRHISVEIDR